MLFLLELQQDQNGEGGIYLKNSQENYENKQ